MPKSETWTFYRRTSPPGSPFEVRMPNGAALCSSGPLTEEQARKAAAAPELYEALETMLAAFESGSWQRAYAALKPCRAALAKARGESPDAK